MNSELRQILTDDVTKKFWANVVKADGCWLWTGRKDPEGYGLFHNGFKQVRAHRYSYVLHWSIIPKSYMVLHTCDNTSCVNPDHLKFGTSKQNSMDCVQKGRTNKGKDIPRISSHIKNSIVEEYNTTDITTQELARKYGINRRSVTRILKVGKLSDGLPDVTFDKATVLALLKKIETIVKSMP